MGGLDHRIRAPREKQFVIVDLEPGHGAGKLTDDGIIDLGNIDHLEPEACGDC